MIEVSPGIWRGARPKSADDLARFYTVVSLQCSTLELMQVAEEKAWCDGLGIEFVHVPMSMILPPSQDSVNKALDQSFYRRHGQTLLHCHDGVDRTGVVIFNRRIQEGWSFGKAIGEMIDMGFHLDRYFWWLPELRR